MAVRGVGFVGVRSDRLSDMVALFRDVLGVPVAREAGDLVGFTLADGAVLELYGPDDAFHAFFTTGPVVGLRVDDFDEAHRAMIGAGIEFIGETQRAGGIAWRHFRAPDGTILEIIGPSDEEMRP
ncbi:MAG TPA: VOC family protein [Roseiarcus sp.]|nr:VOC family protein [Roseiarcus sp.]